MGWAARANHRESEMCLGLRVVVDVQHLYRDGAHMGDRGSVYTLANGLTTTEGSAALIYAAAIVERLQAAGAETLTNDAGRGVLIGPYARRHAEVMAWTPRPPDAYLACHVNAGGGTYAMFEYMSMTRGAELAGSLMPQMIRAFPQDISAAKRVALSTGQRGAVCVERVTGPVAAVLLEPFFGDHPRHQHLLAAPELVKVGEAMAQGVIDWWKLRR